ncbi:MAG: orotate phosphoribosyltransferase [Actinobacteria bacterium]|nr:orotate phosphoribosyltransferase [Actinomycetota bacterium]MCL5883140.1 orotate phosphoribosyltransferase [Actinomycetota bacterium]
MTDTGQLLTRLRQLLLEKAYLTGDFILTSGKRSDHYFDCKQVTLNAEGLAVASELLVEKLRAEGIGAIGGLAIGADPIVAGVVATSWKLGYPVQGFIVRKEPKEHGTSKWIEGPLEQGTRVAIIDDVVTSGGSIIKAINSARIEGLEPVVAYTIVDREEGGAEAIESEGHLPFEALLRYSELFS